MSHGLEVGGLFVGAKELRFHNDGSSYEGWSYGKPNSVGGIGVQHNIYNSSDKVIKYLTFIYLPYNKVKDIVSCSTTGKIEATCELTGPFRPNTKAKVQWDTLWYNSTITDVKIKQVIIEYMDGTTETINGADLKNMDAEDSIYNQKLGKENQEYMKKLHKENIKRELKRSYLSFMVLTCLQAAKEDEEAKFHVNQGLLLFIIEVLSFFIVGIPFIGGILFLVLWAFAIVFSVKGIIDIKNGNQNEIPFIGKFKIIK